MILSFDKLRVAYYIVIRQTVQTEERYNNKYIQYFNLQLNPTVSNKLILYLSLHRYNYKLQTSLICIHTQIQLSAINQSCIYTCIDIIVRYRPAFIYICIVTIVSYKPNCVHTYRDAFVSYRPVLYVCLNRHNCQLQTSLVSTPTQIQFLLNTSLVCMAT